MRRKKTNQGGPEEERRTLGMVLLRGEHLVSMSVDGPPHRNSRTTSSPVGWDPEWDGPPAAGCHQTWGLPLTREW